ncbi:hypothetical protein I4U23_007064 [Adineta vaga]|nr:hypothetical protein I4U23_007064 [Adineta vaga]
MNCSITTDTSNQYFLTGNFGASIFITVYIGLYGLTLAIYFTCQFVSDTRHYQEYKISNEFFSTFHQKNEQEEVYNKLTNKDWLMKIYKIYYSNQPFKLELIEEKANDCSKKYQQKLENLRLRNAYYISEISTSPTLTTTV